MAKIDLSILNDFRFFQLTLNAVTKISIQATCPGKAAYQILVVGNSPLLPAAVNHMYLYP
jgi:hypothetical protein